MFGVFMHGDLGTVKHGGFVHVIPCEEVESRTLIFIQQEFLRPELTYSRIDEIQPA